ncbi:hypothetical protein H1D32_11780 [Anaerobacillus sp. CMMVII]|uniref:hypothetical protein n=1 Tax=Anaerobacillus sp. CMMVII TaxID=2755588 RepID=UPI0021B78C80|nr:hypothetical protein [Anaerobacillus sp. CMMVII]MCT8138371.1 hypothetical protein [Anaerobacillus sp. CMMVII]
MSTQEHTITSFQELVEELKRRMNANNEKQVTINLHIHEIKEIHVKELYLDEPSNRLGDALRINNCRTRVTKSNGHPKKKEFFSVSFNEKTVPFQVTDYYK